MQHGDGRWIQRCKQRDGVVCGVRQVYHLQEREKNKRYRYRFKTETRLMCQDNSKLSEVTQANPRWGVACWAVVALWAPPSRADRQSKGAVMLGVLLPGASSRTRGVAAGETRLVRPVPSRLRSMPASHQSGHRCCVCVCGVVVVAWSCETTKYMTHISTIHHMDFWNLS